MKLHEDEHSVTSISDVVKDVTKTGNGERGTGNGERGTRNGSPITSSQRYPP